MTYRAEIDGLRALAVLPVILFHAGLDLFSGGYVGVDVFFVISGYLITTILIGDIEQGRFSILNFYERRARRILPALFLVMLFCIPFAWLFMLPSQMKDFSQSLVAVSAFSSNILFWLESDYFAAAADEKPLLHTWSLAIEEQYYAVFPVFLALTWRLGKNRVFWVIALMAIVSFLLSELDWLNNKTANFYLAPSRIWELLAGSMAAFIIMRRGVVKNELMSLLGLSMIVFSIFTYDKSTPFPSVYTLVPVMGAVFLVLYGDEKTIVGRLLSTKAFVGIGLISYSAYLWHQPLFAFLKISALDQINLRYLFAIFSLFLAFLSWKFVEKPFRDRAIFSKSFIMWFSLLGLFLFIGIGYLGHKKDGFPDRYANSEIYKEITYRIRGNLGLSEKCDKEFIIGGECSTSSNPEILVWGDSYAMHLLPGLIESDKNVSVQQATVSQCIPILDFSLANTHYNCIDFNDKVYEWLKGSDTKYVLLASPFMGIGESTVLIDRYGITTRNSREVLFNQLSNLVKEIRYMDKIPIIVTPTPNDGGDKGQCLVRQLMREGDLKACNFYEATTNRRQVDKTLKEIEGSNIIDLRKLICDQGNCISSLEGNFLYRDAGHLSYEGSRYLGKKYKFYEMIKSFD